VWGIYWPGAALFLRHPPHFYSAVYIPLAAMKLFRGFLGNKLVVGA
jgi:hypothetical protein